MKTLFLLVIIMVSILLTGCQKETPTQITRLPEVLNPARYGNFDKLPVATAEPDPDGVSFEGIGFAADGGYIMVQFKASVSQSQLWQQDYIYIVDEATRGVYKDIPIMPVVGPLIGRPSKEGQTGYVMLLNYYQGIKNGSVVTVVLGNYKREHVTVTAPPTAGQ